MPTPTPKANAPQHRSRCLVKSFEPAKRGVDLVPQGLGFGGEPCPFPDRQRACVAIHLRIDGGDDPVADQHREREISQQPLCRVNIGFEPVLITVQGQQPLALDHERINR